MLAPEQVMGFVWLLWVVSWFAAAVWSDRAVKRPAVTSEVVYRILVTAGVVLLFGFADPGGVLTTPRWRPVSAIGWALVVVGVGGLAFTWWARIHLGRLWSSGVTRKSAHHVVDTGPYAIVRHPIYTGVILATLATATMRGTAGAWLGAAVMTIGWYIKARVEERFLAEELGAESYSAYARRVPMLVPLPPRRASSDAAGDRRHG